MYHPVAVARFLVISGTEFDKVAVEGDAEVVTDDFDQGACPADGTGSLAHDLEFITSMGMSADRAEMRTLRAPSFWGGVRSLLHGDEDTRGFCNIKGSSITSLASLHLMLEDGDGFHVDDRVPALSLDCRGPCCVWTHVETCRP